MRVDVLGPVRVVSGPKIIETPSRAERALLAALALHVGETVPLSQLSIALWGEDPPSSATKSLRSHLSRLRTRLGSDVARPDPGGYRMTLPREDTDLGLMESLLASGTAARDRGDVARARGWFADAEALWRGDPLVDLADSPSKTAHLEHLTTLRCDAQEGRIRADLDAGPPATAVSEIQSLVAEEPLREPLWGLLMLALYRSGRQVDALRAYERLRVRLGEEWGIDPSPELQRLQWQILRQDPQLEAAPPPPPLVVPAPVTGFVGRAGQVEQVVHALATDRLVTLHGPAGVGKSRLAVEVARAVRDRFPDGVWWVDLTVAGGRDEAVRRLAEALGVTAAPGVTPTDAVVAFLEHRRLLLVLDNCEHVVTPLGRIVLSVLEGAGGVRVLATSRVLLGVSGESRWKVPPLATPAAGASLEEVLASESVVLFQQRRGRQLADVAPNMLADVGQLCRTLDGMPLAIELAAAQAHVASVRELNERLTEDVVDSARQTAPVAHHVGLSAAIDWSYSELEPECRRLFDWLSVFPGDFDADAVEAMAAAMADPAPHGSRRCLARLVDASLVEARSIDEVTRYRLLFVMREFAGTRLHERGETEDARQGFADHYRQLAVRAGPRLLDHGAGAWLRQLQRESGNLRSALSWSLEHDSPEHTLQCVRAVGEVVWGVSPDLATDVAVLHRVLERAEAAEAADAAWGWQALVTPAYVAGDLALALEANKRAEQLFVESGDRAGLACVYWHAGAAQLLAVGDLAAAERLLRQGRLVAQQAGVTKPEAYCLAHLVQLQSVSGTVDADTEQALRAAERLADPDDFQLQAHLRMDRALLLLATGDIPACLMAADDCVDYSRRTGIATYEQAGYLVKGWAMLTTGDPEALTTALRAARIAIDVGFGMQLGLALQQLARLYDSTAQPARAAQLWGAALARAPLFPAYQDILIPHQSQHALAAQFSDEQARGAELDADQALALAIG